MTLKDAIDLSIIYLNIGSPLAHVDEVQSFLHKTNSVS